MTNVEIRMTKDGDGWAFFSPWISNWPKLHDSVKKFPMTSWVEFCNSGSPLYLITDRSLITPPNPTGRSITLFAKKMSRRSKVLFAAIFLILSLIAIWIYRGTGTGYVWSVSGVRIPWPRETTEHYDCDFGHYSVFKLSEESMKPFISDHSWNSGIPLHRYHNDCLTFRSLRTSLPLPEPNELIWMEGASRHEDWTMYLHVPTRRLFVSIGHPDMAGDLPARAIDNHQGEQDAASNGG